MISVITPYLQALAAVSTIIVNVKAYYNIKKQNTKEKASKKNISKK